MRLVIHQKGEGAQRWFAYRGRKFLVYGRAGEEWEIVDNETYSTVADGFQSFRQLREAALEEVDQWMSDNGLDQKELGKMSDLKYGDPEYCHSDCEERAKCPDAGKPGHEWCGWCDQHNLPTHHCGCKITPKVFMGMASTRRVGLPVRDHLLDALWEDLSTMKYVHCRNHPDTKFLTKNPWSRGIFVVTGYADCVCSIDDLIFDGIKE